MDGSGVGAHRQAQQLVLVLQKHAANMESCARCKFHPLEDNFYTLQFFSMEIGSA